MLGNITILPWNDDIKWHDNQYWRNFSIPKYRYHDIIVNIVILSSISQNCWSLQFYSISNDVQDVSVYVLLQLFYWYRDIYNNRDISNDDYRRQKISISPITTKFVCNSYVCSNMWLRIFNYFLQDIACVCACVYKGVEKYFKKQVLQL